MPVCAPSEEATRKGLLCGRVRGDTERLWVPRADVGMERTRDLHLSGAAEGVRVDEDIQPAEHRNQKVGPPD